MQNHVLWRHPDLLFEIVALKLKKIAKNVASQAELGHFWSLSGCNFGNLSITGAKISNSKSGCLHCA